MPVVSFPSKKDNWLASVLECMNLEILLRKFWETCSAVCLTVPGWLEKIGEKPIFAFLILTAFEIKALLDKAVDQDGNVITF